MKKYSALLTLGSMCFSATLSAGARPIEVRFSNLTPDEASTEASKKCVHTVREELMRREYHVVYTSETPLREAVGAKQKSKSFLDWSVQQVQPALDTYASENAWFDGLVALDCRPKDNRLDIVVFNSADYRAQIKLRGLPLTASRLQWVAEEVGLQASEGWTP